MGPSTLLFCPSPGSLRDLQGMGHLEVEVILDLFSRKIPAPRAKKTELDLSLARRPVSICVTVRLLPHFPFRPALCRSAEGVGRPGRAQQRIVWGRVQRDYRPWPKILGILKVAMMIILLGGVGCLGHLPPSTRYACIILHECMQQKARKRAPPSRTKKTDQEPTKKKTRQNQKKQRKGLGANSRDIKSPIISHSPSTNAFRNIFSARLGIIGPFSTSMAPAQGIITPYLEIAPLNGSAFHIFKLHICNLHWPAWGIVAAIDSQQFLMAL